MTQLINEVKRMQQLAGILKEGFLDNIAAGIKGKSEQGKLAQDLLAKMGITKNPAEIFSLRFEGGGAGPFENEVQGYLLAGGDINTKIPFSKNIKGSAGGAIFKETYTFDFSKDVPTMKAGGRFIWNIKGGKWEAKEDDGNAGKEEPMDVEDMKKENDADPGTFATEATMMTIADAAKIWPETVAGSEFGYDKRLKDIVKFMEGKKITKMTPEDVKEFEGKDKKEPAATTPAAAPAAPAPQQESIEQSVNEALRKFRKGK
jgi:hypothetical protein